MEPSEQVNPALIDSAQPIGLVRRFRSTHLDRLYRKDDPRSRLSWEQWYAGDWFRQTWHRAAFGVKVISSYGERTSAGEISYGLPRTEAQVRARAQYMEARKVFPKDMRGFMERFLVHDEYPKYGGRAAMRNISQIQGALNALVRYLKIGC